MGMFDTIVCKYPLPQPQNPQGYTGSIDFQTKDLDNCLDYYEIREDGSFWIRKHQGEFIKGDENLESKPKSWSSKVGYFKTTKEWYEKVNFTGEIIMYDYQLTKDEGNYDYSIEYKVKISKGKVKKITLNDFKTLCNIARKENERVFLKRMKDLTEFKQTLRYKFCYKYYNSAIRYIFATIRKLATNINWYKIENFFTIGI